ALRPRRRGLAGPARPSRFLLLVGRRLGCRWRLRRVRPGLTVARRGRTGSTHEAEAARPACCTLADLEQGPAGPERQQARDCDLDDLEPPPPLRLRRLAQQELARRRAHPGKRHRLGLEPGPRASFPSVPARRDAHTGNDPQSPYSTTGAWSTPARGPTLGWWVWKKETLSGSCRRSRCLRCRW